MNDEERQETAKKPVSGAASRTADRIWKVVGVLALIVSIWLLSRELRSISFVDVAASLAALTPLTWLACLASAIAAYVLLGGYERLALAYLGRRINPVFVHICAAATYAFAHMIGASVLSGAVVRYRAYSTKGLSGVEIATLVAFCTFTFCLGVIAVLGAVLVADPSLPGRFVDTLPFDYPRLAGEIFIGGIALYLLLSALPLPALHVRSLVLRLPPFRLALLQVVIAAAEIVCAALIVYLALPQAINPGLLVVIGVFIIAFSAALISHSPGGLGVFELVFLAGLSNLPRGDVLAALLVFRLFYFLIPFILSIGALAAIEARAAKR